MSDVNAMSTSKQKAHVALLQKNSIKTKNIEIKLNKLQILNEFNKQKNSKLMF